MYITSFMCLWLLQATSHEPLIEVEDYDKFAGATSTTRIQSSNPVSCCST